MMGSTSSLGPIDAQVPGHNGKRYSADAFLEGLDEIKQEVENRKTLNPAYIPILQNISPGEIQHCKNAQAFSRGLVTDWLTQYKFKYWKTHSSSESPVTQKEKEDRAHEIADLLCKQSEWKTHGRSIKISDLTDIGLKIVNYEEHTDLSDAINRYYTLLRLTFDHTAIIKIYETETSQIYTSAQTNLPPPKSKETNIKKASDVIAEVICPKCHLTAKLQLRLDAKVKPKPNLIPYPKNNIYICSKCGLRQDLTQLKLQVEAESGKKVLL
jgi:hypothetical protein